jgi:anti-sigma regulatory factor (Ser/Thr protein kinase)
MFERMGRLQQAAQTLGNIGLIYEHTNDLDKAASFFRQSIKIFEAAGNQSGMAEAYNNLANLYQDKNRQDSALVFYHKSAELNRLIGNKKGLANAFTNMGLTYLDFKKYDSSYFYFTRALAFYQEMGDKYGLASAYNGLGRVYAEGTKADLQKVGVGGSNAYGLALENQKKGLALAREIGEIDVQSEIWKSLSETYEKQKDYAHALAAYKSYVELKDSIINDEKKTFLTQKQLQYEYDKKTAIDRMASDQEIALAQAGARQQKIVKNFVIAISLIAILFAVAILIIYKRRRDEAEQKHDAEFRAKVAETEMKALRAQMNPHFIFNSLNSIGDYISQHDHKSANDYLARFAKVMRMILENSEQKLVSLADDLKALELYMQLEAMRLQNKFRYDIFVEEGIDPENILIPPLILQPFVENSIWHGLMKKNGNGRILISVQKDADMLLCIVEDNGIGREKSDTFKTEVKKIEKQSLGMKITNSRIDILNKVNKSNAEITLTDLDEGMRAEVRLPLQLSF